MRDEDLLIIGTRGSALALRQTELVAEMLRAQHPYLQVEVRVIETVADRIQDRSIASLGDKGVFVRGIELALLNGSVDAAVHSLKDVPADVVQPELELTAFSPRADPRDALVSGTGTNLADLSAGSRVGTSSPRRRLLLRELRDDLELVDIRGNVDTRLRKLDAGEYDAIVLAAAGLVRLGLDHRITEYLPVAQFVPDAGQGIMAVQTCSSGPARDLVSAIDDSLARACAVAERAVVSALGADCTSPVGAHARASADHIELIAVAAQGTHGPVQRAEDAGPLVQSEVLGDRVGKTLRTQIEGLGPIY